MASVLVKSLAGLAVAAAIGGALYVAFGEKPILVDLATVETGPLQVVVAEDGVTRIRNVYAVSSPIAGHLDRIEYSVGDAIGAVLSRSAIPSGMDVKALVSDTYETPGGGLFVGYFFAYFGIAGVIVASIALAALLIYLKRSRNPMAWPFLIICAAYAPRTLLYDYTVMIKMCLVAFILLKLLKWTTPSSSRVRRRHAVQKTNTPPGWREKEAYGK